MTIDNLITNLMELSDEGTFARDAIEKEVFKVLLGPDRGRWRLMLNPAKLVGYLPVTRSLDAARQLFQLAFPGWLYRVMECAVTTR